MHGLVAKKVGMTRIVDEDGQMIPVTLLQVAEQAVTKVCSLEKEGYHAIQVGYFEKAEHRINKPDLSRLRKASVAQNFTRFKEFRLDAPLEGVAAGAKLSASLFDGVTSVDITGFVKGRGFEGAIRRWNHARGRMTHGSDFHRRPGSLGTRTTPGRVFKNKEQPGQWGNEQCTVKNLKVLDIDTQANTIAIRGSVPGFKDGFVFVRPVKAADKSKQ